MVAHAHRPERTNEKVNELSPEYDLRNLLKGGTVGK
jgi:hypothetical protein